GDDAIVDSRIVDCAWHSIRSRGKEFEGGRRERGRVHGFIEERAELFRQCLGVSKGQSRSDARRCCIRKNRDRDLITPSTVTTCIESASAQYKSGVGWSECR